MRSPVQPAMEATDAGRKADDAKHIVRSRQLGNNFFEMARVADRPIYVLFCVTTIVARLMLV
jgi:hypothetical protein